MLLRSHEWYYRRDEVLAGSCSAAAEGMRYCCSSVVPQQEGRGVCRSEEVLLGSHGAATGRRHWPGLGCRCRRDKALLESHGAAAGDMRCFQAPMMLLQK